MTIDAMNGAPGARDRWLPRLLALAYLGLFVLVLATSAGADETTTGEVLITDHAQSTAMTSIGMFGAAIAATILVFAGGWIRTQLRAIGDRRAWLADVTFAGTIVLAAGLSVWAMIGGALQDAIDTGDPVLARSLNLLDSNGFVLTMAGMSCAMLSAGASAWASRALPRWLAGVSILLGVAAPLGPGGFAAFFLFPLWLVTIAFVLSGDRPVSADVTVRMATAS